MLISPVGANIGVNFAIPADAAIPVIEALKAGERPQRGYLGIGIVPVPEDYAEAPGLHKARGEMYQRVEEGEASAKEGLKSRAAVAHAHGQDETTQQTTHSSEVCREKK